jgi:hypothetical protein
MRPRGSILFSSRSTTCKMGSIMRVTLLVTEEMTSHQGPNFSRLHSPCQRYIRYSTYYYQDASRPLHGPLRRSFAPKHPFTLHVWRRTGPRLSRRRGRIRQKHHRMGTRSSRSKLPSKYAHWRYASPSTTRPEITRVWRRSFSHHLAPRSRRLRQQNERMVTCSTGPKPQANHAHWRYATSSTTSSSTQSP